MPHGSRIQLWITGLILLVAGSSATGEERIFRIGGPPATASRVPAWDARGAGLLPWQGIACIDLSEDGRFAAIGTIAPPGDPNVFLVDEQGKLSAQHEAGRRWIHEVAVTDDGFVAALCTTPTGEAGDRPLVRTFPGGEGDHVDPLIFHYGGHSNHLAPCLTAHGNEIAVLANGSIRWLSRGADSKRADATPVPNGAEAVAFAIAPPAAAGREDGTPTRIAVALAASGRAVPAVEQNLLLLERGRRGPLWSRVPETAVAPAPPPEPGVYGPPAPPYEDIECRAPLSVAISNSGTRLAAADYQGWERWFGDGQGLRFGRRFMPARPVITIYDEQGKVLRRFGPDTFSAPGWCDLVFSPDAARLLAFPHGWPCRGLAGQAFLPTDDDARRVYALHVESGAVDVLEFPDAVSQLAVRPDGGLVVGCWNGRLYLLAADLQPLSGLQDGLETGAPCLVGVSRDGHRILAATTDGVVRMLDSAAKEIWRLDLNQAAQAGDKPWARNQQPGKIAAGVWRTNGGLAHSDMGGQYLIEAPDGLILIDPNGGLSFEQNWAKIAGAGLDPGRVRYVLVTHEHGDHAPEPTCGAWRRAPRWSPAPRPRTVCSTICRLSAVTVFIRPTRWTSRFRTIASWTSPA